ncbi:MAG: 4Fe-4S dicluster domain-containing protein [Deltaproteobacteria bacterium]|nr:4Fe-4S dicluster domain-containing protein [Deltaproteobacteria bacterium]
MNRLAEATRPIMWNVPFSELMYLLFAASLAIMVFGLVRRISVWRKGTPDADRLDDPFSRLLNMLWEILTQQRVRRSFFPGFFHSLFFYSFIVFVITTGTIALDTDFGTQLFNGYLYVTLTLLSDIAGFLFLLGLGMAIWRRVVTKPNSLNSDRSDVIALALLTFIVLTGFLLEGLRIAMTNDPWAALSPVGYLMGPWFENVEQQSGLTLHASIWWLHTLCVMTWIALIPYTKFFHLITLPANAFFVKRKPAGELSRIDLEAVMEDENFDPDSFSIGLGTTRDFTWKQRLNLDACVACGRCDNVCPAVAAGLSLSPKQFILGMKKTLYQNLKITRAEKGENSSPTEIVGNAFDETFFWHCRTCRACDSVCPAFIDHVDTQIDVRRSEVNMQSRMPEDAEKMLRSMETLGNPFGQQSVRIKWTASLDVPIIRPGDSCDVLYWIGCLTTFDPDKQQISLDVINLLQQTGTDFGILGEGEICCGDPARICGEENLFQMTASQQVEELKQRNFKTLLVSCPHCLNVLKNEYPQFGGNFQVIHHTEFLQSHNGSLKAPLSQLKNRTAVFHDPCYLGRYQGAYQAPRQLLKSLPDLKHVEMNNAGRDSFCCGAGGGHYWMDIKEGERINVLRVNQAMEKGADTIVTACPFCHHMLNDALKLKDLEDKIQVRDIASLLTEPTAGDERQ